MIDPLLIYLQVQAAISARILGVLIDIIMYITLLISHWEHMRRNAMTQIVPDSGKKGRKFPCCAEMLRYY